MQEAQKQCSKCGEIKDISGFTFDKQKGKHTSQCKACRNNAIKAMKHSSDNKERYQQQDKQRNAKRRDYLVTYMREYHRSNPKPYTPKPSLSCPVYFLVCQRTGQLFTARLAKAKYSAEGRRLIACEKSKDRAREQHEARSPAYVCQECNETFTPAYGTGKRAYCSDACGEKAAMAYKWATSNHRKRARYYGVAYEPINIKKVFCRDNWTCKLCGCPTPEDKRGTYDADAPELDHIMPMSQGGGHTLANVQCACRNCNSAKGASLPPGWGFSSLAA